MGKDTKRLQRVLNQDGFGPLDVDGIRGPKTRGALRLWATEAHGAPQGFDASSFQPFINWVTVRAAGVSFVALRAGASLTRDTLFAQHWAGAKGAGLLRAAYQYFACWQDPIVQARATVDAMGADRGELPIVLDVEAVSPKDKRVIVSTPQLIQRTGDCLLELERLTGRRPLLYSYPAFCRALHLGDMFKTYKFWVADYREGPPELLGGVTQYVFHQYAGDSGRQSGVLGPCDLDRFHGTQAELEAL